MSGQDVSQPVPLRQYQTFVVLVESHVVLPRTWLDDALDQAHGLNGVGVVMDSSEVLNTSRWTTAVSELPHKLDQEEDQ